MAIKTESDLIKKLNLLRIRLKDLPHQPHLRKKYSNETVDGTCEIAMKLLHLYRSTPVAFRGLQKAMIPAIFHLAAILYALDKKGRLENPLGGRDAAGEIFCIGQVYLTQVSGFSDDNIKLRRKQVERALLQHYAKQECPDSSHRTCWYGFESEKVATRVYKELLEISRRP